MFFGLHVGVERGPFHAFAWPDACMVETILVRGSVDAQQGRSKDMAVAGTKHYADDVETSAGDGSRFLQFVNPFCVWLREVVDF